jgi:hypothetical protein
MSRALTVAHKTEIAQTGGNAQAYLIEVESGGTTQRYSTFGQITHASHTWFARSFLFSGLSSTGAIASGTQMSVEDVDGTFAALALIEDGDILVRVYSIHVLPGGGIESQQIGEFLADEPAWDRAQGSVSWTLRDTVPLELPGLTMGVATGLGEMIAPGTEYLFGSDILVLGSRS